MRADRTNKIRNKEGGLLCSGGWVNYVSEISLPTSLCTGWMLSSPFCNCCLALAEQFETEQYHNNLCKTPPMTV